MATFRYTARTKDGEMQTGVVEAASQDAAVSILHQHQLIITSVVEKGGDSGEGIFAQSLFQRVSRKEIVDFSRQLSILFEARVPLIEALRAVAQQSTNPLFHKIVQNLIDDVSGGTPLSDALSQHPKLFGSFFVNMVKSGEASGKLQEVLVYLANQLERDYDVRSKIRGAFLYPAFILIVFAVVTSIMVVLVLPKIAGIFQESGTQLPLLTRFIFDSIDFFRRAWVAFIVFLGIGIFSAVQIIRTPEGRAWTDLHLFRVPVVGNLIRAIVITRFADNLSALVSAGVPITRALEITGSVVGNTVFQDLMSQAVTAVQRGEQINTVLRSSSVIPPTVVQMVAIGEQTGRLDGVLVHVARFYRQEVDRMTNNLTALIEPFLIVVLGLGIGIFVAAILLPIYTISSAL